MTVLQFNQLKYRRVFSMLNKLFAVAYFFYFYFTSFKVRAFSAA